MTTVMAMWSQPSLAPPSPQFPLLNAAVTLQVLTKRGKRLQKHYTVFVCAVPRAARDAYKPTLNAEHSQWRWTAAVDLRGRDDLHPVVYRTLHDHWLAVEPLISAS